jgi:hypothetical protein
MRASDYSTTGIEYSNLIRFTLSWDKTKDISENERWEYINQAFISKGASILKLYEGSRDISGDFTINLDENELLARERSQIVFRVVPNGEVDYIEGRVAIEGPTYEEWKNNGLSDSGLDLLPLSDSNSFAAHIRSSYTSSKNWSKLAKWVFGIMKIIFNLVMIGITFGRPFMPEWMRLRAAWIGQTAIFYQLMMYTGLTVGRYGGVIDQVFERQLWLSRRYFFISKRWPSFKDRRAFVLHKHYEADFIPYLLEECFFEVVVVALFSIIAMFQSFSKGTTVGQTNGERIVRQILSSASIFSVVPITLHFSANFFSWTAITDRSIYAFLNIALGLICMASFSIQLGGALSSMEAIKALHEQKAYARGRTLVEQGLDWCFDSFVDKQARPILFTVEIFTFMLIFLTWTLGYVFQGFSIAILILCQGVLLGLHTQKRNDMDPNSNEREAQRNITELSLLHLILRFLEIMILGLFWLFNTLLKKHLKLLSWIYLIVLAINCVVLLAQLLMRLVNLGNMPEYYQERLQIFGAKQLPGEGTEMMSKKPLEYDVNNTGGGYKQNQDSAYGSNQAGGYSNNQNGYGNDS